MPTPCGLDASGSDLGRQAVVVHALADTPDEGVRCWYRGQLPIPLGTEITLPVAGTRLMLNVTGVAPDMSYVDVEVANVPDPSAGIQQVFSGGDGVIYTVTHTGDLLWYRHEGRGDGTFRWAADAGKQVGSGWDVKQIFSGGDGIIYAIRDNGDLIWNRHLGNGDGTFRWAADTGKQVGRGWDVKQIFSGDDGVICTINDVGDLLGYRHEGRGDGTFRWAADAGKKVGNGWDPATIFSGGLNLR